MKRPKSQMNCCSIQYRQWIYTYFLCAKMIVIDLKHDKKRTSKKLPIGMLLHLNFFNFTSCCDFCVTSGFVTLTYVLQVKSDAPTEAHAHYCPVYHVLEEGDTHTSHGGWSLCILEY